MRKIREKIKKWEYHSEESICKYIKKAMIITFLLVCVMQIKTASVMAFHFPYYIYTSTSKDQDMEAYEEYLQEEHWCTCKGDSFTFTIKSFRILDWAKCKDIVVIDNETCRYDGDHRHLLICGYKNNQIFIKAMIRIPQDGIDSFFYSRTKGNIILKAMSGGWYKIEYRSIFCEADSQGKDVSLEEYEEYKFYENNDSNRKKYLKSDANNKNSKYKQIISTKKNSYNLAYGTKPFGLGAKASGGGKLIYRSSNTKVATVSSKGKVSLKGTGTTTITIMARATSKYYGASKKIKVTVGKKSIRLSKNSLTMSLAGAHTYTLKATTKYTSSKITWKSSNTRVAKVDKNGKITVKGGGTSIITAKVDGITATCNLTVKDTAEKTIKLNFSTYDEWQKSISKEEKNLIFGGKYATLPNGTKYYAGNIIVKRKVLSYKTVKMKIYKTGPKNNNYITIYLRLPNEIKYTLHRHNLKNNVSSSSVGKLMVGLVDKKLVLTQKCSCGFKNTLTWESPLNAPKKLSGGETYTVVTTSLMID